MEHLNRHRWENDGEWTVYLYGYVFRGIHKRTDGQVSYFEFDTDLVTPGDEQELVNHAESVAYKEYAKPREWVSCIRCGARKNLDTRPDFNNACMCDRCYKASFRCPGNSCSVFVAGSGNTEYEITPAGLKGKQIKPDLIVYE